MHIVHQQREALTSSSRNAVDSVADCCVLHGHFAQTPTSGIANDWPTAALQVVNRCHEALARTEGAKPGVRCPCHIEVAQEVVDAGSRLIAMDK